MGSSNGKTSNSRSWTSEKVIIVGSALLFALNLIDGTLTLGGLGIDAIEEADS